MRSRRGNSSALAPAVLLGAAILGIFLFFFLLNTHSEPIRLAVAKPALVLHPGAACQAPCYTVNVTNVGGSAGNVMCRIQAPGQFVSGAGGSSYLGLTPLEPDATWVLFVRLVTNSIPAPPPIVSCLPLAARS